MLSSKFKVQSSKLTRGLALIRQLAEKGFTMIELLIVIAVLGVLAVAVLSAINPIEQINRGRDTSSKSDAEQLLSAIDRYNASQQVWPWQDASDDDDVIAWSQVTAALAGTEASCPILSNLRYDDTDATCQGTDEIKMAFVNRVTGERYNALYMDYGGDAGDSVHVCYSPQSRSFSQEADRRCLITEEVAELPADACGGCDELVGAAGDNENCVCLP
jgi:prepilin-type N-terminal cleavage/methylation domain-containing protein